MGSDSIQFDDKVLDYFKEFRENSFNSFVAKLRRRRAEQIRELLSSPGKVDLKMFNEEVWRDENETTLYGKSIKGEIFHSKPPSPDRVSELEKALDGGELELQGNYTWGSGSNVYFPSEKDASKKTEHIRAAVTLLTDEVLSPLEKAHRIVEIPGFGENITTGLVMVFHPSEFAIYNQKSKGGMSKLGGQIKTLEAVPQKSSEQLSFRAKREIL
jgi:hypothetical protein